MPDGSPGEAATASSFNEALDFEYSPSNWPSADRSEMTRAMVIDDYISQTKSGSSYVYSHYGHLLTTLKYGERATEEMDIISPVRSEELAPESEHTGSLLGYIHGGYWQEGHFRMNSMHLARPVVEAGHYFAGIGYLDDNAQLSLTEITQQIITAINKLADYVFDSNIRSIVLSGSSAGAHLVAMAMVSSELNRNARDLVKGVALLSGVYDIVPLLNTSINIPGLEIRSETIAKQLSPMLLFDDDSTIFKNLSSNMIGYGEAESAAFKAQANNFAKLMRTHGIAYQMYIGAGRDHFNLVSEAHFPNDALAQVLVGLLNA